MAKAARRFVSPWIIWAQNPALKALLLRFDHALMQPGNGIKRRQDGSLLPCRKVRRVLARQHDPAVDLAEIVIVLRPRLFDPVAGAAHRKGHAMPGNGDAALQFGLLFHMNVCAALARPAPSL